MSDPLDDIASGEALVKAKSGPDALDDNETALYRKRYEARTESIKQSNENKKAHRKLRITYGNRVFCYLVIYSIASFFIILLDGFGALGFQLPVPALTAVVGSTAVSAIGLVLTVVQGLYRDLD